jgi:hypothetical protein
MSKCVLLLLLLSIRASLSGQNAFKQNDIYFEFLGNGVVASLNYERQLKSEPGLGIRLGVGYFSADQKFRVSIPVAVNYLFSFAHEKSFLDVSLGGTWSRAAGLKTPQQDAASGGRDYREHLWSLVPGIGYRRHTRGNFMWRASLTPIINKYRVMPWPGLSIGKRL